MNIEKNSNIIKILTISGSPGIGKSSLLKKIEEENNDNSLCIEKHVFRTYLEKFKEINLLSKNIDILTQLDILRIFLYKDIKIFKNIILNINFSLFYNQKKDYSLFYLNERSYLDVLSFIFYYKIDKDKNIRNIINDLIENYISELYIFLEDFIIKNKINISDLDHLFKKINKKSIFLSFSLIEKEIYNYYFYNLNYLLESSLNIKNIFDLNIDEYYIKDNSLNIYDIENLNIYISNILSDKIRLKFFNIKEISELNCLNNLELYKKYFYSIKSFENKYIYSIFYLLNIFLKHKNKKILEIEKKYIKKEEIINYVNQIYSYLFKYIFNDEIYLIPLLPFKIKNINDLNIDKFSKKENKKYNLKYFFDIRNNLITKYLI